MTAAPLHGVVTRVWRAACEVALETGQLVECTVRGRLLHAGRLGNRVVVGDIVTVEPTGTRGAVTTVAERGNAFLRRAAGGKQVEQVVAANLDRVLLVASADSPLFRAGFVDRVLVQASHCGIHSLLVINKADLVPPDAIATLGAPYARAGYAVMGVSAREGSGVDELRHVCGAGRTLFIGQSGVGKSTLLNALFPGLSLKEGAVNPKTHKGRHTTSTAWMLLVAPGLEVIDTPGMRGFGLWDIGPQELDAHFPELVERAGACRFRGCSHRTEPGCAVRAAVEHGEIDRGRYDSFLKLREELALEHGRLVR